jgi:PadR family transcriptional regulator, regulatory protein PadR
MSTTSKQDKAAEQTASALPRRFLRQLLFLALGREDRSYGYELAEAVRGYGLNIDMAAVYRELRNMERRDLLTSEWEPSSNGPDRRVYLMTVAGHTAQAEAISELRQARDQLSVALEDAPGA